MAIQASGAAPVGFIGIGAMGFPMAQRLMARGHALVVHDTSPEAVTALGAQSAASPREVAQRCEVVFCCLPSLEAYRTVVLGADGLREGRRMTHYVHLGTTGSALVEEFENTLTRCMTIDAPVTGGPANAVEGRLTSIVSASTEALDTCRPMIESYSAHLIVVSQRPGAAQQMKLINNIVSAANLAVACEALVVGARSGLDPAMIVQVFNRGSGQNSATLTKIPAAVLTRSFDWGAALRIVLKDGAQFLRDADAAGVPVEVARAVIESYRRAASIEGPDADMTTVIRQLERAADLHATALPLPS